MYLNPETFIAGADLSAKNGYGVKFAAALVNGQESVVLAGAGEDSIGTIVQGTVANGSTVVRTAGLVEQAILGDTVSSVGTKLKMDASGKYIPVTGSGKENVVAEARGTGVAGNLIKIMLLRQELDETVST